ncbi:hypothetical protein MIND_00657800 [Mycena indigotica]|uniref:DUF6534 domain-containing protein n=1 Tax=Mycena indigotica TaxID=2126181 RepID=A0A8H6W424_9AGAR|nr:uncharacterized protein MIND_00657800 [Mycena indigotica]KAF7300948.1 hypothetical protein MIND_00657800 [Mycena indigotica]
MAAPPVALPNVTLSYGPMLIGVFVNMILYGVLLTQILTYYTVYKADALWMRVFVGFLFFVETANTALDMYMMYQPLILEYGQKPVFFPDAFMTEPLIIVLVSMPIQLFFAWRIYQLTKSVWVPILIVLLGLASFAGGVWTTVMIRVLRKFAKKPLLHAPALLWFLTSCVADVLITISLVLTLSKKKTGFSATDSVVDKIIRATIQTGLITAVFSIMDVICFMVFPHYAINFVWDLALSKLYTNCLLSTLNARHKLNSASHASTYQHQRNFVMSPIRSGSNGKQESFIDTAPGPTLTFEQRPRDLEYGVHMTKVVERVEDPISQHHGRGNYAQ